MKKTQSNILLQIKRRKFNIELSESFLHNLLKDGKRWQMPSEKVKRTTKLLGEGKSFEFQLWGFGSLWSFLGINQMRKSLS
jgi:hypothetical protein